MVLGLEPLHPMVCASRSVLSTMKAANDWRDQLEAPDVVGIVVDTYKCGGTQIFPKKSPVRVKPSALFMWQIG
ncbi:MAG: hypothetical protein CM1200mP41_36460 [Gammaproteobacteria bacterium]|nr:MAG: hypothetical protein CM1200mP41_36460 [Gammaproteobacteria bacterium]